MTSKHKVDPARATRLGDIYPLRYQPNPDAAPRVYAPHELLLFLKHIADDMPIVERMDWPIPARVHVYRSHLRNKLAWRMEHLAFLFAGPDAQSLYLEALRDRYFKTFDCAAAHFWDDIAKVTLVNPLESMVQEMVAVGILPDRIVDGTRYLAEAEIRFLWMWLEFQPQINEALREMSARGCGWLDLIPGAELRRGGENGPTLNDEALKTPVSSLMSDKEFFHTEDYSSVRLRGKVYNLTTKQSAVVQALHENFLNGFPDVRWERLKDRAGIAEGRRPVDFLKENSAVRGLIKKGTRKGTYRLNLGDKANKTHP